MALSGSVTTNKYDSKVGLKLTWTGTQSIANNTTKISWTLKSNGGSSGNWWYAGPVKVVIGGKTVLNTTSRFKLYGGGAYKKTGSLTINHNADGSKSVSMSVKAAIYSASVNCTGSSSFTLNKIDRYALITGFESFNDEGSPIITYSNTRGPDYVTNLKLRVTWNSGANYTDWYTLNDAGGTYTLNLSLADRSALRLGAANTNTLPIKFDLQSTMDGSDWHDEKASTMEIINADPTPGVVSFADTNPNTTAITPSDDVIVQRRSNLEIVSTASTGEKGATIVDYKLNFNGNEYPFDMRSLTFGGIDLAGTYTATVTTIDSRGNTATASVDILIYGWTEPSALYSFARVQNFVTNDAILHVDGNISSVPGSSMLITESHSEKGSGIWSAPATVPDNDDFTISNLDYQKEYELIITVSDSFTRADSPPTNKTYTLGLGKGIPLAFFDIKRHSVGVNEIPDADDQLYVGGTIKATGKITAPSMSVSDISSLYALAKSSGNWKLNEIKALRTGNVIHLRIELSGNGSSVSAGSNGFVGTLSGGPLPALSMKLISYYNNCPIMMNIEPDGSVTARVTATSVTVTTTGSMALTGTFITND